MGKLDTKQLIWGVIIGIITFGLMGVSYKIGINKGKEQEVLGEEAESVEMSEREVQISFLSNCESEEQGVKLEEGKELYSYCLNYEGEKSAYDYLKLLDQGSEEFSFDYDESDFGVFITSVNNYHPDVKSKFWAFLVNGEMSMVGVADYVINEGDTVVLRIEEVEF